MQQTKFQSVQTSRSRFPNIFKIGMHSRSQFPVFDSCQNWRDTFRRVGVRAANEPPLDLWLVGTGELRERSDCDILYAEVQNSVLFADVIDLVTFETTYFNEVYL